MMKIWPGCFNHLFSIWNVTYGCHLLAMSARSFLGRCYVLAALSQLQNVVDLGHTVQFSFLRLFLQFQVISIFCGIQWCTIFCEYSLIGSSNLSDYNFFQKCPANSIRLSPANHVSPKGKTGLHSDSMSYNRVYVVCHIGEIDVLWVHFILLAPPVSDIRWSKCTANLHWVGVVIIMIRINLPPVLWWLKRWIQIEPCGCPCGCCAIALSGCRSSHAFRR